MWDIALVILVLAAFAGMCKLHEALHGKDDVDGWELW